MNTKKRNKKRTILSMMLVLALAASTVLPWVQTTVRAEETGISGNTMEFTFGDESFYKALKNAVNAASILYDDPENRKLTLDPDQVKQILMYSNVGGGKSVNITRENSLQIFEELVQGCNNLEEVRLESCALGEFDLSLLFKNKNKLKILWLDSISVEEVPGEKLPSLETFGMYRAGLGAESACTNITAANYPKLKSLYVTDCALSNINFIKNLNGLETLHTLSLADSRLKDASVDVLLETDLPNLEFLNVGKMAEKSYGSTFTGIKSTFVQMEKLAALPGHFTSLTELDLRYLGITSLEAFQNVRPDVTLNFRNNSICEFAGCETKTNFNCYAQEYTMAGEFVEGREYQIAEPMKTIIKKVCDETDGLYSDRDEKLDCKAWTDGPDTCSISEDMARMTIARDLPDLVTEWEVTVRGGKINGSTFTGKNIKRIPSYEIPQGLTARIGDTLADVVLPVEPDFKWEWKDKNQKLETAGVHTCMAVYAPSKYSTGQKYVEVDVEVPVTVLEREPVPTVAPTIPPLQETPTPMPPAPTPVESTETPVPVTPAPTNPPAAPTPVPVTPAAPTPVSVTPAPTQAPAAPTPVPVTPAPTQAPAAPTPVPVTPAPPQTPAAPTPVPVTLAPTQAPAAPTPVPVTPTPEIPMPTSHAPVPTMPVKTPDPATPKPDESKQSGNEIEDRKDLSLLLATGKQKGKNGVRLTWRKWNGCTGYEVYWSFCDGKRNYKKLKTVPGTGTRVADHKKLKKTRAYKYYVAAYEIRDGRKYYLAKSPTIHVAMNKEPRTNAKNIRLNKKKVTLKTNQAFQIKPSVKKENKKKKLLDHELKYRYYVDDKNIVSLSQKGRIRAKAEGVCTVFVIANNGVTSTLKVTVKD